MKTLLEQELYFVKKFKVGDEIRNTDYERPEEYVTIVYIGKGGFSVYDHEDGDLYSHDYNRVDKWYHYEYPVKQGLAVLEKFYLVKTYNTKLMVYIEYGESRDDVMSRNSCNEVLTEQEAIERGLVIWYYSATKEVVRN